NTWSEIPGMNRRRYWPMAVCIGGKLIVAGGRRPRHRSEDNEDEGGNTMYSVESYDLNNPTSGWTRCASWLDTASGTDDCTSLEASLIRECVRRDTGMTERCTILRPTNGRLFLLWNTLSADAEQPS
ncbi:hypothetical protein PMAYCL1PPCAC_06186, partial [Pristionchus mayeri]